MPHGQFRAFTRGVIQSSERGAVSLGEEGSEKASCRGPGTFVRKPRLPGSGGARKEIALPSAGHGRSALDLPSVCRRFVLCSPSVRPRPRARSCSARSRQRRVLLGSIACAGGFAAFHASARSMAAGSSVEMTQGRTQNPRCSGVDPIPPGGALRACGRSPSAGRELDGMAHSIADHICLPRPDAEDSTAGLLCGVALRSRRSLDWRLGPPACATFCFNDRVVDFEIELQLSTVRMFGRMTGAVRSAGMLLSSAAAIGSERPGSARTRGLSQRRGLRT